MWFPGFKIADSKQPSCISNPIKSVLEQEKENLCIYESFQIHLPYSQIFNTGFLKMQFLKEKKKV